MIPMDAVGDTCFERANAWIVDTPLGSGGSAHRGGTTSGYVDHGHHAASPLTCTARLAATTKPSRIMKTQNMMNASLRQAGRSISMPISVFATSRALYRPIGQAILQLWQRPRAQCAQTWPEAESSPGPARLRATGQHWRVGCLPPLPAGTCSSNGLCRCSRRNLCRCRNLETLALRPPSRLDFRHYTHELGSRLPEGSADRHKAMIFPH